MGKNKWTYERCYEIAKEYNTKKEFKNNECAAYTAALRNDWLKEFTWFKQLITPANYWTYEKCYEEAKKYTFRADFQRKSNKAYKSAFRNKWLDDYTWMKTPPAHNKKWNYDTCLNAAKEFDNYTSFIKTYPKAANLARKEGWISEYFWLKKTVMPNGYWTYEKCYEEAKKYNTRSEFEKGNGSVYSLSLKNGWINDYIWMPKHKKVESKWSKDICFEIGRKYKTKSEFEKSEKGCYLAAMRAGWLQEMNWFIPKAIEDMSLFKRTHCVYVYKDDELNVAYIGLTSNLKVRHLRHKKCGSVFKYFAAINKEIPEPLILMDNLTPDESRYYEDLFLKEYKEKGYKTLNKGCTGEYCGSFGGGRTIYTEEKSLEIAKNYKTLKEFRETNPSCYNRARMKGWINQYTWLKRIHK